MLPSARPGSKTNFVVAKLYVLFLHNANIPILSIAFPQQSCRGRLRLCLADRITSFTLLKNACTKLTIARIYGSSKCLLPLEHPGSK